MYLRNRPDQRSASEGGFTLVELIVTVFAAMVVLLATLAVLDLSTRQAARTTDRIETSQRGRTAMEQLVQQLHSSCVAASVTPVRAGSDASNLLFLSQFGSAAVLSPNKHVVTFASGKLTDSVYPATRGTAPNWTFSGTPTVTKTLVTDVSQALVNGTSRPVFEYFSYVNGQVSSVPLPTPLSLTDAANAVEITISFAIGPADQSTEVSRITNLSDSVVLRYAPASGVSTIANLPCQ